MDASNDDTKETEEKLISDKLTYSLQSLREIGSICIKPNEACPNNISDWLRPFLTFIAERPIIPVNESKQVDRGQSARQNVERKSVKSAMDDKSSVNDSLNWRSRTPIVDISSDKTGDADSKRTVSSIPSTGETVLPSNSGPVRRGPPARKETNDRFSNKERKVEVSNNNNNIGNHTSNNSNSLNIGGNNSLLARDKDRDKGNRSMWDSPGEQSAPRMSAVEQRKMFEKEREEILAGRRAGAAQSVDNKSGSYHTESDNIMNQLRSMEVFGAVVKDERVTDKNSPPEPCQSPNDLGGGLLTGGAGPAQYSPRRSLTAAELMASSGQDLDIESSSSRTSPHFGFSFVQPAVPSSSASVLRGDTSFDVWDNVSVSGKGESDWISSMLGGDDLGADSISNVLPIICPAVLSESSDLTVLPFSRSLKQKSSRLSALLGIGIGSSGDSTDPFTDFGERESGNLVGCATSASLPHLSAVENNQSLGLKSLKIDENFRPPPGLGSVTARGTSVVPTVVPLTAESAALFGFGTSVDASDHQCTEVRHSQVVDSPPVTPTIVSSNVSAARSINVSALFSAARLRGGLVSSNGGSNVEVASDVNPSPTVVPSNSGSSIQVTGKPKPTCATPNPTPGQRPAPGRGGGAVRPGPKASLAVNGLSGDRTSASHKSSGRSAVPMLSVASMMHLQTLQQQSKVEAEKAGSSGSGSRAGKPPPSAPSVVSQSAPVPPTVPSIVASTFLQRISLGDLFARAVPVAPPANSNVANPTLPQQKPAPKNPENAQAKSGFKVMTLAELEKKNAAKA